MADFGNHLEWKSFLLGILPTPLVFFFSSLNPSCVCLLFCTKMEQVQSRIQEAVNTHIDDIERNYLRKMQVIFFLIITVCSGQFLYVL